jgi:hypothetical protein
MRKMLCALVAGTAFVAAGCNDDEASLAACIEQLASGPLPIATVRTERFLGKVRETTARCRGGEAAARFLGVPWLDWTNYYGTGDATSRGLRTQDRRGVTGALIDLEYERVELIKFNLFDNNNTFEAYVKGVPGRDGSTIDVWRQFRLPPEHPAYATVGGAAEQQRCQGAVIRGRSLTGICNDLRNPLMGSTGAVFANNTEFETVFPDAGLNDITRNRHGDRLSLLVPDPQVISRKLFTRDGDGPDCASGFGKPDFSKDADCDYKKAPFFNVLAAFWIQFMTHDWFTHMADARNDLTRSISMGCASERVNNAEQPITPARADQLGCRPTDKMEAALFADKGAPPTFKSGNKTYMARSPGTTRNLNTAWWDASQIYGYDDTSRRRMRRDPTDPAKLQLVNQRTGTVGDEQGYLPEFGAACAPGAPGPNGPDRKQPRCRTTGRSGSPSCTPCSCASTMRS